MGLSIYTFGDPEMLIGFKTKVEKEALAFQIHLHEDKKRISLPN